MQTIRAWLEPRALILVLATGLAGGCTAASTHEEDGAASTQTSGVERSSQVSAAACDDWSLWGMDQEWPAAETVETALANELPDVVVTATLVEVARSPSCAGTVDDPDDPFGTVLWQQLGVRVDRVLVGDSTLVGATLEPALFKWSTAFEPVDPSRVGEQVVLSLKRFEVVSADEMPEPQLQVLWTSSWAQRSAAPGGSRSWVPYSTGPGGFQWDADASDVPPGDVPDGLVTSGLDELEDEIRRAGRALSVPVPTQ